MFKIIILVRAVVPARIVPPSYPRPPDCPQGLFRFPPVAVGKPTRRYLILSKANVATAKISPTSQNLVTIFASGIGWLGHCILAGIPTF